MAIIEYKDLKNKIAAIGVYLPDIEGKNAIIDYKVSYSGDDVIVELNRAEYNIALFTV